jgi:hypothetical protein
VLRSELALLNGVEAQANDMGWDISQAKARVEVERLERQRAVDEERDRKRIADFVKANPAFGAPKPQPRHQSVLGGDPMQDLED